MIFLKASSKHQQEIFSWLAEPHVREFWDNTEAHREDILNFIGGRQTPSPYANGEYVYWVALQGTIPYALFMTLQEKDPDELPSLKHSYISKKGTTYTLEYMIGNPDYVGKGLGASTLSAFIEFFQQSVDPLADTFFIDPSIDNPRARRVYERAGFEHIDDYVMDGAVSHAGIVHHFMVKKLITIAMATLKEIQDLGSQYNAEADYSNYITDSARHAFSIKLDGAAIGFALINQIGTEADTDWNLGEFFIHPEYQRKGYGRQAFYQILKQLPGKWEVSVLLDNEKGIAFWRDVIDTYTQGYYIEEVRTVDFDLQNPRRLIFLFKTR